MSDEATVFEPNPRLTAFLSALPHAGDEEFVNAPGLGMFRARYIRRGLERGVLVVHSTQLGLAISQPSTHGACGDCRGRKGSQPCIHCTCEMCTWMRQTDERASPPVSRARMVALAAKIKALTFAGPPVRPAAMLDDDL